MGLLPVYRRFGRLAAWQKSRTAAMEDVSSVVADILQQVRSGNDDVLFRLTAKYDGVNIDSIETPADGVAESEAQLSAALRTALLEAAANIRRFHQQQVPPAFELKQPDGTLASWRWRPIKRVGIYVPGGRHPLASSLLMSAIPAQVAGVEQMVVCTPPQADGKPDPTILGICGLLGIDQVYRLGGAQAIGALAYGTNEIEPVDKIVGPGNAYVAEAKAQVAREVGIDMPAGPTEVVVLADSKAKAEWVAVDLISQAEHDPQATAILVTCDLDLALAVNAALEALLPALPTPATVQASLENHGSIYVGADLNECVTVVNFLAPEHLCLQTENPRDLVDQLVAGAIFLGNSTPVAWGDYWAGPNHTLPTGSQARFRGPLSVLDFLVAYSVIEAPIEAVRSSAKSVLELAQAEGLAGHGQSITARLGND